MIRACVFLAAACMSMLLGATPARAQAFPDKPVRLIVPFAPGGGADVLGRIMAKRISEILGQPIVVENHPGAGGTLGSALVARAPADGYTMLIVNANAHVAAGGLYPDLKYNPVSDFTSLGAFGIIRYVLVVNPKTGAGDLEGFVKQARSAPGKLDYASAGVGSGPHLAMEMLRQAAKLDMRHVPYKGSGPALVDVAGGHVGAAFDNVAAIPLIRSGQLRALAITGKRSKALPDVPTFAEAGLPGFDVSGVFGLLAPKDLPAPVATVLRNAVLQAANDPGVQQQLVAQGIDPEPASGSAYDDVLKRESARWLQLIRSANIKL